MKKQRALQAALAEPWAITAEGHELVLAVAARENDVSFEALEAYRAEHVPTAERLTRRGSVAMLDVRGPLFNRANLFTSISGATSYDMLRRDLQAALDDPGVTALVMRYDTPGGAVADVDELAKAIRAGKEQKPIIAYVGNQAASAGYWLASQSTEIVVSETAMLGSIGVRAAFQDKSQADAAKGVVEFISSQSPGKRTDLSSDEGRARIQRTIDALADVFIATVAEGRRVKAEDVIANFGGGDVLIGSAAVAAGMADRLGSFEAVVSELAGRGPSPINPRRTAKMDDVITRAEHDAAIAEAERTATAEAAVGERNRIRAILALDEAKDRQKAALHTALSTDMTPEAAGAFLAGLETEKPAASEGLGGAPAAGLELFNPDAAATNANAGNPWAKVTDRLNGTKG